VRMRQLAQSRELQTWARFSAELPLVDMTVGKELSRLAGRHPKSANATTRSIALIANLGQVFRRTTRNVLG